MAGLEPARLAPLPPQDSVSTNSTTSAAIPKDAGLRAACRDAPARRFGYHGFGARIKKPIANAPAVMKKFFVPLLLLAANHANAQFVSGLATENPDRIRIAIVPVSKDAQNQSFALASLQLKEKTREILRQHGIEETAKFGEELQIHLSIHRETYILTLKLQRPIYFKVKGERQKSYAVVWDRMEYGAHRQDPEVVLQALAEMLRNFSRLRKTVVKK